MHTGIQEIDLYVFINYSINSISTIINYGESNFTMASLATLRSSCAAMTYDSNNFVVKNMTPHYLKWSRGTSRHIMVWSYRYERNSKRFYSKHKHQTRYYLNDWIVLYVGMTRRMVTIMDVRIISQPHGMVIPFQYCPLFTLQRYDKVPSILILVPQDAHSRLVMGGIWIRWLARLRTPLSPS